MMKRTKKENEQRDCGFLKFENYQNKKKEFTGDPKWLDGEEGSEG